MSKLYPDGKYRIVHKGRIMYICVKPFKAMRGGDLMDVTDRISEVEKHELIAKALRRPRRHYWIRRYKYLSNHVGWAAYLNNRKNPCNVSSSLGTLIDKLYKKERKYHDARRDDQESRNRVSRVGMASPQGSQTWLPGEHLRRGIQVVLTVLR